MKPLLIAYRPARFRFEVTRSCDLTGKGFSALQSHFLTGNQNPYWLVGEADSHSDALREVQRIAAQLTRAKTTALPPCIVVEMHLWSGAKGEEAKWR